MAGSLGRLSSALDELLPRDADPSTCIPSFRDVYERAGVTKATAYRYPEVKTALEERARTLREGAGKPASRSAARRETARRLRMTLNDMANLVQHLSAVLRERDAEIAKLRAVVSDNVVVSLQAERVVGRGRKHGSKN